jgi:TPR repeat protein
MADARLLEQLPEGTPEASVAEDGDLTHGFLEPTSLANQLHSRRLTWSARSSAVLAGVGLLVGAACTREPTSLAPAAALPSTCPLEGCDPARTARITSRRVPDACPTAGEAPCAGAAAAECTERALSAWADAEDDREVSCVARMLTDACGLGDVRACGYAGRMWLEGRGVTADADRGLEMVVEACDGGVALECMAGLRWLSESGHASAVKDAAAIRERLDDQHSCLTGSSDACMQLGVSFYWGNAPFPKDLPRAAIAYQRGCDLGHALSCSNLGDAYEYGNGVPRDLAHAAVLYDRACRAGQVLGCANLGHLAENGEGVPRDTARAKALYRDACTGGEVYACLHLALMAAENAGAPRDPARSVEHWQRACDRRDARACTFIGLLFEDGPDGYARDEVRSMAAMSRACDLGNQDGCVWLRSHGGQ